MYKQPKIFETEPMIGTADNFNNRIRLQIHKPKALYKVVTQLHA